MCSRVHWAFKAPWFWTIEYAHFHSHPSPPFSLQRLIFAWLGLRLHPKLLWLSFFSESSLFQVQFYPLGQVRGYVDTYCDGVQLSVVGGNEAFPQDHEENTLRTHAGETVCGKGYLGRLSWVPHVPLSCCEQKSSHVFSKARTKPRVQNLCFTWKTSPLKIARSAVGLMPARPTWSHVPG